MAIKSDTERILEETVKLGKLLGTVKDIYVREEPHEEPVKVTRYIRVLNPWGEITYMTEWNVRRCEELGLSTRRI